MKEEQWINADEEVRSILEMIEGKGEGGVSREGLQETPGRVSRAYSEMFKGYKGDVQGVLSRQFEAEGSGLVIVKDIEFNSMCEHHVLPFIGVAHIGYVPGDKIVGLSKLARVVDIYANRLQVQERLQTQVVEAIMKYVRPKGVAVIFEAKHQCMSIRGVKKPSAVTITTSYRGDFLHYPELKKEFLFLVKG